jgi:hypothetical protein
MVVATISLARLRDLARLGRSRAGLGPLRGPNPASPLRTAGPAPMLPASLPSRRRVPYGQLTPRTDDLMASPI